MRNVRPSKSRSCTRRGCSSVRGGLVLLALSCALLSIGCPKTATTVDPACPAWNEDEWHSFGLLLARADDETEPAVLATGALLAYCFPEAFEIVP
jgi:hypothetical protein